MVYVDWVYEKESIRQVKQISQTKNAVRLKRRLQNFIKMGFVADDHRHQVEDGQHISAEIPEIQK